MAIVRWDPFREFGGAWMPPVDIYSTGDHELVIKAEIPGINKDDIEITVENFTLTIRGEKKTETEDKERRFSERYYGHFERRIAVEDIEQDKVSASFKNGVLSITLPKSQTAQQKVKRIAINGK